MLHNVIPFNTARTTHTKPAGGVWLRQDLWAPRRTTSFRKSGRELYKLAYVQLAALVIVGVVAAIIGFHVNWWKKVASFSKFRDRSTTCGGGGCSVHVQHRHDDFGWENGTPRRQSCCFPDSLWRRFCTCRA